MPALALEALKALGVNQNLANKLLEDLELALNLITDPEQRTAEFAVALAEMRDGKIPSIVLNMMGVQP